jgi:putative restriction endonuclease
MGAQAMEKDMESTSALTPDLGPTLPPPVELQNGDRLTREEFHRRYEAMPHVKKAELIEGVVYMPSPVRHRAHGKPQFDLIWWLGSYVVATPGVEGGDNGTLKLDMKNEPQPDAYLIVQPEYAGQVLLDKDDYIIGGPELVGEVSASSVSIDLHDKLEACRRNKVLEYVVWRVLDRAIDWFILRGDRFEPLALSPDGFFKSVVFPGLWLDPQALIAGNLPRLQEVVQQGVQSAEHADFVKRLAAARQG